MEKMYVTKNIGLIAYLKSLKIQSIKKKVKGEYVFFYFNKDDELIRMINEYRNDVTITNYNKCLLEVKDEISKIKNNI